MTTTMQKHGRASRGLAALLAVSLLALGASLVIGTTAGADSGGLAITSGTYDSAEGTVTVTWTLPTEGQGGFVDEIYLYPSSCDPSTPGSCVTDENAYWPIDDNYSTSITVNPGPSPSGTWYALVEGGCATCTTELYSQLYAIATPDTGTTTTTTTPPVHVAPGDSEVGGVVGTVEIKQADGTWLAVGDGATLGLGQEIRTDTASKCTLTGSDGTQITLGYNSSLTPVVDTPVAKPSGSIVTDLIAGAMRWTDPGYLKKYFGVVKMPRQSIVVAVRGTDFVALLSRGTQVEASIAVHRGTVVYTRHGRTLSVTAGTQILIYAHEVLRFKLTAADWKNYLFGV